MVLRALPDHTSKLDGTGKQKGRLLDDFWLLVVRIESQPIAALVKRSAEVSSKTSGCFLIYEVKEFSMVTLPPLSSTSFVR